MSKVNVIATKANSTMNWSLVFVAYAASFAIGLLDVARGPYFPDITLDLSLTDTQASLFFVVASIVAFFGGKFVPPLAKNIGLLNTVRLGQVLMSLGFASISFARSLITLLMACGLFGLGYSLVNVGENLMILNISQGQVRRRLLSGLHGMYAFAALVAPLVAAQLFRLHIGWREAYIGFAGVVMASFISSLFAREDNAAVLTENPTGAATGKQKLGQRSYFIIGSMLSLYVLAELVISTRLSLYVRRVFDYSPDQASLLLALFYLFLLAGRFLFLLVPFKMTSSRVIEISLVASFIAYALGLWVHPWLMTLCGLAMAPVFGLSVDLMAEIYPESASDAIASCLALSSVYIVLMHFSMGILTDIFGIGVAMHAGLFFLLSAWLLLKATCHQKRRVA